jgi:hypothetical protein
VDAEAPGNRIGDGLRVAGDHGHAKPQAIESRDGPSDDLGAGVVPTCRP